MPTTLLRGRPLVFCSAQTMASSGLVTQMTKASGAYLRKPGADLLHDLEVDLEEIVAAHAGLARDAGGDDTTSESLISAYSLVPLILGT